MNVVRDCGQKKNQKHLANVIKMLAWKIDFQRVLKFSHIYVFLIENVDKAKIVK